MITFYDIEVGSTYELGPEEITEEEIIRFAKMYDPKPEHTDPNSEEAKNAGGVTASGFHTCAIMMKMICEAYLLNSTSQGAAGLDKVEWFEDVKPGTLISGVSRIVGKREMKSRSDLGLIMFEYELYNQQKQLLLTCKGNGIMGMKKDG